MIYDLTYLFHDHNLMQVLYYLYSSDKLYINNTLLRPIIIYGAETWPLRKVDDRKLIDSERKVLRKIYDPIKDNNNTDWRIRTHNNQDLIFQRLCILKTIKNILH